MLMRLQDWLRANKKSPTGFSREIGLAASTIPRVLKDGRATTHNVMCRIIVGSNGEVLPNDFFDIDGLLGRRSVRAKRRA